MCVLVDRVTTDEELEKMLHRNSLTIFIADVGEILLHHRQNMTSLQRVICCNWGTFQINKEVT